MIYLNCKTVKERGDEMFSDHDRVLTPEEVTLGKELKELLSQLRREEKLKVIGFSAALATMQVGRAARDEDEKKPA